MAVETEFLAVASLSLWFGIYIVVGALIAALLADRKARSPLLWGVAGATGFVVTLIGLAFFGDLQQMDQDSAQRSRLRERTFCAFVIFVGTLGLLQRLL